MRAQLLVRYHLDSATHEGDSVRALQGLAGLVTNKAGAARPHVLCKSSLMNRYPPLMLWLAILSI